MSDISDQWSVDPESGCWLWRKHVNNNGYGLKRVPCSCGEGRRAVLAHRFVYELFVGPIPEGLHLDHLCRVRHCVNPSHLEPVTTRENTIRGVGPTAVNAAATHCHLGHPFAGDNLIVRADGSRRCRTCNRARNARYRAQKRAG
jgi:hypothetical protein